MLTERDFDNPHKNVEVELNTELKRWIVEYVGNRFALDSKRVTPEMVVEMFSIEFPEFLWVVAEENYMRGYQQALEDMRESE
jgi:predicted esterase YcpF (UPF0227 family)